MNDLWVGLRQICHDVGLAHVDKQVVLQWNRSNRLSEDTVADLQVFDEVGLSVGVEANLELPALMLLLILLLAGRNYEVVDDLFVAQCFLVGVQRGRAVCVFLASRLMDHSRRTAVGFHLIRANQSFPRHRLFAAKVGHTIKCFTQWLLTCQSMLIYADDLTFLEEC